MERSPRSSAEASSLRRRTNCSRTPAAPRSSSRNCCAPPQEVGTSPGGSWRCLWAAMAMALSRAQRFRVILPGSNGLDLLHGNREYHVERVFFSPVTQRLSYSGFNDRTRYRSQGDPAGRSRRPPRRREHDGRVRPRHRRLALRAASWGRPTAVSRRDGRTDEERNPGDLLEVGLRRSLDEVIAHSPAVRGPVDRALKRRARPRAMSPSGTEARVAGIVLECFRRSATAKSSASATPLRPELAPSARDFTKHAFRRGCGVGRHLRQ